MLSKIHLKACDTYMRQSEDLLRLRLRHLSYQTLEHFWREDIRHIREARNI